MSVSQHFYDVIIVGGGPAGTSCALVLANSGLKVCLVDKAKFPRDKICGDALSADVVNQLPKISSQLYEAFGSVPGKLPSFGVRIFSPNLASVDLPFQHQHTLSNGYLYPRFEFDNLLMQQVKQSGNISVLEECQVESAACEPSVIRLNTTAGILNGKLVVGADGAQSLIRKIVDRNPIKRNHHSAGLRVYYEGVQFFHNDQYIDLYFLKDILPGYLWVFPMTGGRANVGIGILSSVVSAKKLNLRKILHEYLTEHPHFKKRFAKARSLETVKGFGLPLGSEQRIISSDRVLLLGDAAGLIDPFSGEGIANAIRSGRVAGDHIMSCFRLNNFSASFNTRYDEEIYRRMGREFNVSKVLQRLCRYPWLFNYVVKKANKSTYWHSFLVGSLSDIDQKQWFARPRFYYNLLMK